MADALDLGSSGAIHGGSSPFTRTMITNKTINYDCFFVYYMIIYPIKGDFMLSSLKIHNKINFAYHITHKNNMVKIIKKGLIPQCGQNCNRVGDHFVGVYFVPSLEGIYDFWMNNIYDNEDIDSLIILRFDVTKMKIIQLHPALKLSSGKWDPGEWIVQKKIKPQKIEYLANISDANIEYDKEKQLWLPIKQYKLIK